MPRPRHRLLREDLRAIHSVVGETLMLAAIVALVAGLGFVLKPAPAPDDLHVELRFEGDCGDGVWNNADDRILLHHKQGEALPRERTTITIWVGTTPTTIGPGALDGAFSDGSFTLSETWIYTIPMPSGGTVSVDVAYQMQDGQEGLLRPTEQPRRCVAPQP